MMRSFNTERPEENSSFDSSIPVLKSVNKENKRMVETVAPLGEQNGQLQEKQEKLEVEEIASQDHHQIESTYLEGMKLYLMLLGVGATCFLMMLDQTIVVTVCLTSYRSNTVRLPEMQYFACRTSSNY
jgi:hypothetical protein